MDNGPEHTTALTAENQMSVCVWGGEVVALHPKPGKVASVSSQWSVVKGMRLSWISTLS